MHLSVFFYGDKASTNVDECRYKLFKSGKSSDDALPPNYDSLLKHIERLNQQALAWKKCLSCQLHLPPPAGNGWRLSDGQLEIVWSTLPSAPDSLIECIDCKCKTDCSSCLKAGLGCTALCGCEDCQNGRKENIDADEGDLLSSDTSNIEKEAKTTITSSKSDHERG